MSDRLRHLSARPQLVAGALHSLLVDNVDNVIGKGGAGYATHITPWLGRARIVTALKIEGGGQRWLRKHAIIRDSLGVHLIDPDGYLVGMPGVVVTRMLDAGKVQDTRRL